MLTRFLRFFDGMLGRSLSLRDIDDRAQVSVEGEVVSPNVIESPVSPVKAALLDWAVFGRKMEVRNDNQVGGTEHEVLTELTNGRLGEALIVGTEHGTVYVPLRRVIYTPHATISRNTLSIMQTPGSPVAEAIEAVDARRHHGLELTYGERYVCKGDRVILRAIVKRLTAAGGGPYRGASAKADFEVVVERKSFQPRLREIL